MSLNFIALSAAPIIELDTIDSTNNYAMRLIDADTAQPGLTITAKEQTHGKGQRGKAWTDTQYQSLLMSVITTPIYLLSQQFVFNAAITVAIVDVLQAECKTSVINIKWPNDIIVNDKKAGGILIENVLRGGNWTYSIIGFGLNINQQSFPDNLPFATSLKIAENKGFDITGLRDRLRANILKYSASLIPENEVMKQYNAYLYKKGAQQSFSKDDKAWEAAILQANTDGTLKVQEEERITDYTHGSVIWNWK